MHAGGGRGGDSRINLDPSNAAVSALNLPRPHEQQGQRNPDISNILGVENCQEANIPSSLVNSRSAVCAVELVIRYMEKL